MSVKNGSVRLIRGGICAAVVFMIVSPVFGTEWYQDYFAAQKALKQKDWATARELLKQALQKEPEEGVKSQGARTIRYFPSLLLGHAYLATGDWEAARSACEQSKAKGAAPKLMVERCLQAASQHRHLPQPLLPLERPQQAASQPQETPSPAPTSPPLQPTSPPAPQEQPPPPQAPPLSLQSATQASVKVAILNFQSILVPAELGTAVAEILRTELVGAGHYIVIERGMVEEVLKEQQLQLTGAVDSETAVKVGKLVGAKLVLIGSIVKTGAVYTINSRLLDVETGIVTVGANIQGKGEDDIPKMVQRLVGKLTGKADSPE